MTKIFKSAAFVGVALVDCGAAMAGPPAINPLEGYNWSGAYVGFEAGGINQHDRYRGGLIGSSSASSGLVGVYSGYNWQFSNNIVLGVEGRFDGFDTGSGYGTLESRSSWTASVAGRIGYAFSPGVMLYASGGGLVGNLSQNFPGKSDSATVTGGTIGGGVEINLTRLGLNYKFDAGPKVLPSRDVVETLLRFDYRHQKFGKETTFGDLRTGICSDVFTVGIAVKFNAAPVSAGR